MPKRPTLKQQMSDLRREARARGLGIRKDQRLCNSPYRAMHPLAAKELKQPTIKSCITYCSIASRTKRRLVMDIRHEIVEFDKMKQGARYKTAHKRANRVQRTVGAEKRRRN